MGLISVVVDAVLVYFSVVVLFTVPLVDSQCALPASLYPDQLVRLKRFFEVTYDDYMFEENTPFFVGIVWMEIFFLWPLCLANIYGLVRRKSWVGTTLVMVGVAVGTAMGWIIVPMIDYKFQLAMQIASDQPYGCSRLDLEDVFQFQTL